MASGGPGAPSPGAGAGGPQAPGAPVRLVREGLVELELPEDARLDRTRGPQRAGGAMVFYNPAARPSRDLTVTLLRALPAPASGWRVLDGLCGSGVRGLRIAREVERVAEVVLNDGDPRAASLARRQVERLALPCVRVTQRSLEATLADFAARFEFIDIDPFGSPARFLSAAAARAGRPGYFAATATDLAALCGVFPAACLRRYGAAPLHNEWMKETAARILLGAAVRKAGAVERAVVPVATLSSQHFLRIFCRVERGSKAADRAAGQVGFVRVHEDPRRAPEAVPLSALPKGRGGDALPGSAAGPLWLGDLHDAQVLERAVPPEWVEGRKGLQRYLELARGEVALPPWHFSLDEVARKLKGSPPPTGRAVDALRARGFAAARTHFDPKAVKTTASPAELIETVASLAPAR